MVPPSLRNCPINSGEPCRPPTGPCLSKPVFPRRDGSKRILFTPGTAFSVRQPGSPTSRLSDLWSSSTYDRRTSSYCAPLSYGGRAPLHERKVPFAVGAGPSGCRDVRVHGNAWCLPTADLGPKHLRILLPLPPCWASTFLVESVYGHLPWNTCLSTSHCSPPRIFKGTYTFLPSPRPNRVPLPGSP